MQLTLESKDFRYVVRGTGPGCVLVNERQLTRSFVVAQDTLVEDWRPESVEGLAPADLEPVLALGAEVVLLGTGDRLLFPAPAIMAACLTRGVGIEAMDNAAAARTFNVLMGEGRKVAAAFLLPGG